jgi:hypothetical protein
MLNSECSARLHLPFAGFHPALALTSRLQEAIS